MRADDPQRYRRVICVNDISTGENDLDRAAIKVGAFIDQRKLVLQVGAMA